MPTRNVNLTPHLDAFVETGITSGRFSNASEIVREGLRLLEQREAEDQARIQWLRNATEEAFAAFDRGEGIELSSPEQIDDFVNGVWEEVQAELSKSHG